MIFAIGPRLRSWSRSRAAAPIAIGIASWLLLTGQVRLAGAAGGTITGVVKDAFEQPLAGVAVRLESPDGQMLRRTNSDDAGRFVIPDVPAGTYTVVAEREGFVTASATGTVSDEEAWSVSLTLAERSVLEPVVVTAPRVEDPRVLSTPRSIGAPVYEITEQAIHIQPGGENNSLTRVLLQAPGVTQDASSVGGIHVRNQMGNIQYRINGVMLPEGTTLFGQSSGLSPRLAESITLLTGALPAEYGLRTTGVFDIETKSGALDPGGHVGMYGGSQSWLQPSAEYGGTRGPFSYFLTADYLQNSIGISPATPNGAIHDDTRQGHAFGYFDLALDATSKLSAVVGIFVGHFQIPTSPGATPSFTVDGISSFNPVDTNETQLEQNYFGVLSYRKAEADRAVQLAAYARYGSLSFRPDPLSDLLFNGIAQRVDRSSIATGLQADARYAVTSQHTVRTGMLISAEQTSVQASSLVLPAENGVQTSDQPIQIFNSTGKIGYAGSLYLQDEWRVVPQVTINAGLRFDGYSSYRTEWQLSPRLSLVWQPTSAATLHVGYARYFTPPRQEFVSNQTFAKFDGTTAAPEVPQNFAPRAERANYLDGGINLQALPGFKVGLDGYYKQANYQLDEGQFGAPVFLTPFNYRRAYTLGIELTTTLDLGNFSAYGNLAAGRQQATGIASAQALFSAEDYAWIQSHYIVTDHSQLVTASAGMSYLWRGLRASVDMISGSGLRRSVVHPNDSTNPAYQQVNFGLTYGFVLPALGQLQTRFDIINVLNNNYVLRDGTGVGVFAKQFGPPRGFFGGLKKVF
ncbi:MAG TPA: TonB-dependent receptor [Candidatus Methylomirabilis sp.]|nr:TonB-dependent receptor [Candidatus Methylomirabilis sp.]